MATAGTTAFFSQPLEESDPEIFGAIRSTNSVASAMRSS